MTRDVSRTSEVALSRRAAAGLLAGAAAGCAWQPARATTPVRFSYQRSSTLLTLLKTDRTLDGRFAAKGFGVSWNLFDNVIEVMNSGVVAFDADVADAVPVFTQAAGTQLTFYAREIGNPAAEAVIVHDASPVHTVTGLKGKSVAVHRGSGCHYILAAKLKNAGMSFRDIKPVYLTPSDAGAAFERGSVDAWSIWDPFLALTQKKLPTRTLFDASGLSHYHRYYSVSDSFVAAHPDLVQIVFDALVEKGRWVKANPRAAAEKLSPIWGGMPVDVVELANGRRTYDVKPVEKDLLGDQQRIADTFYEAHLIPKAIDATALRIWHPEGSRT